MQTCIQEVSWEGKSKSNGLHPDLAPGAFNGITRRFKSVMKTAGWDAETSIGIMVPLAVKIYNPALKRPQ